MTNPGPKGSFFRLYYPCTKWNIEKDTSIEYPPWIPSRRYSAGFAKYMHTVCQSNQSLYMRFFEYHRSRIFIPTLTGSKLISPEAHVYEMPIIVFSHGLASCRTMSSAVCMDWASYGFLVAAVEHRDGSAAYTYHLELRDKITKRILGVKRNTQPDANTVQYVEKGMLIIEIKPVYDFNFRNHQLSHRRREVTNCLNALVQLHKGTAKNFLLIDPRTGTKGAIKFLRDKTLITMFKGRLNILEPIATGHSFGGATGLVAVLKDNRFKCGVVLDPWTTPLGPEVYEVNAFERPFMIIDSSKWLAEKHMLPLLRCLLADQVRALAACPANLGSMMCTIRDTNHQSFTDFMLICGPRIGKMLSLREEGDPVSILQYIRQLSIAFIKLKTGRKEICWPQGSKHILEAVRCGQHIDIKHGQRFLGNNMLGYEMEVQRLITFERKANKDKAGDEGALKRTDSHPKTLGEGKFVSSAMSVAKRQRQLQKHLSMERMKMDSYEFRLNHGSERVETSSASSPEFSEARSFYRKETTYCFGCCRREVRKIKQQAKTKDPSGNPNLSDVVWLRHATNFPFSICKWVILQQADVDVAEKWLNKEAFRHGYRVDNASLPRGLISLQRDGNVWAMIEVDFHGRNQQAVIQVAESEDTYQKLQNMANVLTAHQDEMLQKGLNTYVLSGAEAMSMEKNGTSIKSIFLSWNTNPEIKVTLKKGAIYLAEINSIMATSITNDKGISRRTGEGTSAVMVMMEPVNESIPLTNAAKELISSICGHILRENPLTLGNETPANKQTNVPQSNNFGSGDSKELNIEHQCTSSFDKDKYKNQTKNNDDISEENLDIEDVKQSFLGRIWKSQNENKAKKLPTQKDKNKDQRAEGSFTANATSSLNQIDTMASKQRQKTEQRTAPRGSFYSPKLLAGVPKNPKAEDKKKKPGDEEARLLFQRYRNGTVLATIDNCKLRILDFVKFECRGARKDLCLSRHPSDTDFDDSDLKSYETTSFDEKNAQIRQQTNN